MYLTFVRLYLITIFCSFFSPFSPLYSVEKQVRVVASIAPYSYFIEQIGGSHVKVYTLVPSGASAHSYEPSAKQILEMAQAEIWFSLFERYETKAMQAVKNFSRSLKIVDLRKNIELIHEASCHCSAGDHFDPHLWLSPKNVKVQVALITSALMEVAPMLGEEFKKNGDKLVEELEDLDRKSQKVAAKLSNKTFLVSHPSYAYFARDYGLNQLSIEVEGKDPSAKQLCSFIAKARQTQNKVLFVQPQHSSKGAGLIARQLGISLLELDPYQYNYFNAMYAFLEGLENKSATGTF